jgi:hypothetical protein
MGTLLARVANGGLDTKSLRNVTRSLRLFLGISVKLTLNLSLELSLGLVLDERSILLFMRVCEDDSSKHCNEEQNYTEVHVTPVEEQKVSIRKVGLFQKSPFTDCLHTRRRNIEYRTLNIAIT